MSIAEKDIPKKKENQTALDVSRKLTLTGASARASPWRRTIFCSNSLILARQRFSRD